MYRGGSEWKLGSDAVEPVHDSFVMFYGLVQKGAHLGPIRCKQTDACGGRAWIDRQDQGLRHG